MVITGPDGALNQVGAGAMGEGVMTMFRYQRGNPNGQTTLYCPRCHQPGATILQREKAGRAATPVPEIVSTGSLNLK